MQAELVLDAKAQLAEGPLWDEREGLLYWVDILGSTLHCYNPTTGKDVAYDVGQHVGTVVLDEDGHPVVAVKEGFARFDLATNKLTFLATPEREIRTNRFNDGKADPAGRFWAGTMAYDVTPHAGSLYCLDLDGTVTRRESDVTISNGIVWTPDHKTMYYIDSPPGVIYAFDYDKASGAISDGRIIIKVPSSMGVPDGMAIDSKGQLWVAHWGYSAVVCWCPSTGEVVQEVSVPASHTSACAFGGDDLNTLYITTASDGLTPEQAANEPHAGGIFAVQTDVQGLPSYRYRGL